MDREWLGLFWDAYRALADEGKADAPGGAEFTRVLTEAIEASVKPADFAAFITKAANELLI